jgi:hypothetical protein
MKRLARAAIFFTALATVLAEEPRPFSTTLSPADRQRLGLGALTPAQLAELDAAIAAYTRGEKSAAVQQAVAESEARVQAAKQEAARQAEEKIAQAEKKAATTAVEDYKKKSEPGVIARTLEVFKRQQAEAQLARFTARVVGQFRGWNGGTYFPLTDGQVWRQTGTETYELPPVADAEVEIYQSKNGYWRLKYADAWITVKRVQ